jgi:predicted glutamine amidotransferase
MCELLGMSANVPTDICFSFSGLMQRGGKTGFHRDGWGVAFYEGNGCRVFHDPDPSAYSEIAHFIKRYPIHSTKVLCHIRKANRGRVCLENTHPFVKQMWGRNWCFAHNGQLKGVKKSLVLKDVLPVGTTDSEHVYCWMLEKIYNKFSTPPKNDRQLWQYIETLAAEVSQYGVFNFLLSDSKYLYAHCSTKLVWLTRKSPFGQAALVDEDLEVDFNDVSGKNDVISIIATQPLTHNEVWHKAEKGDFLVFRDGLIKYQST